MASKKEDNRDIFETALEEREAFERDAKQLKYKAKREKEFHEANMRGILGGALGLGVYALGRKLIRKRVPKFDEGIYTIPPIAATSAGALAAVETGSYPAAEAERRHKKNIRRKE